MIVLTGATGFVGRHVLEAAAARDEEVVCLVRGPAPDLLEWPGVQLRSWDTLADWRSLRPRALVHVAAAGVQPGDREPAALEAGNRELTLNLLEAARDWPLEAVVHVGSCAEYGQVGPELVREDRPDCTPGQLSPYGAAKLRASLAALDFARGHGLPLVVARLFNVFGPGEAPARLLPYLVGQLRRGQPADLSPGTQVRDFTYVANVVDGVLRACTAPKASGHAINVATGGRISLLELLAALNRVMGTHASPEFGPARVGDVKDSQAAI